MLTYKYDLISAEVFSALVTMAMIRTQNFPFVVGREIEKYPQILEVGYQEGVFERVTK